MSQPVALVTGGRRGIGKGCVLALAKAGFEVAFTGQTEDDGAELAARCRELGGDGKYFRSSLQDLDAHAGLIEEVTAWKGGLDCLVNNAGVGTLRRGDLMELTSESFDRVIGINLRGSFFLSQAVANWMLANPSAHYRSIVTVSSVSAKMVSPERGDYCMSKAAMGMMNQLFAVRLAPEGIGVFEVRPGVISTDLTAQVKDKWDRLIGEGLVPAGRWGLPEDIGKAIVPLVNGTMSFATGTVIDVDGALSINRL